MVLPTLEQLGFRTLSTKLRFVLLLYTEFNDSLPTLADRDTVTACFTQFEISDGIFEAEWSVCIKGVPFQRI